MFGHIQTQYLPKHNIVRWSALGNLTSTLERRVVVLGSRLSCINSSKESLTSSSSLTKVKERVFYSSIVPFSTAWRPSPSSREITLTTLSSISCWCPFTRFGKRLVSFWLPKDSTSIAFFFLMNSSCLSLDLLRLKGFILGFLEVLEEGGVQATFPTHLYLVAIVSILGFWTRLTSSPLVLDSKKSLSISITLGGTSWSESVSNNFRFPKESEITQNILVKSQHFWSGQLVSFYIYIIIFSCIFYNFCFYI